jgi:hypothetical protein
VCPRTGLDKEKRQILPLPGFKLQQISLPPVSSHYIDCADELQNLNQKFFMLGKKK